MLDRRLRLHSDRHRAFPVRVLEPMGSQSRQGRLQIDFDLPGPFRHQLPHRIVDELVLRPSLDVAEDCQSRLNLWIQPKGRGFASHETRLDVSKCDVNIAM